MLLRPAILLLFFGWVTAGIAATAPAERRLVSICLPGDQLLLQLVPRGEIAALSYLATDPDLSPHWREAAGLPVTGGRLEELIALRPTLVLVGKYSTPGASAALRKAGIEVVEIGFPESFDGLRQEIRAAAKALDADAAGERWIAAMDARLKTLKAQAGATKEERPSALFVFQDGTSPDGFATELLDAAGFRLPPRARDGASPLERVLLARPQFLLRVGYREGAPTFTGLPLPDERLTGMQMATVPFRYLACPDPASLDLVEQLIALRKSVLEATR